jgi:hypothetical protein
MTHLAARRLAGAGLVAVASTVLLLSPLATGPARADGAVVTFKDTATTVPYGATWDNPITVTGSPCYSPGCDTALTISYTGAKKGSLTTGVYQTSTYGTLSSWLGSGLLDSPLPVGTYHFSASYSNHGYAGSTTNDFVLTVTPAAIGTDLRVGLDALDSHNAVITAVLTGDYISTIGIEAGGPPLPAGIWHVDAKDATGGVVLTQDIQRKAGGAPSVNVYWLNVTAQAYNVSASFTPDPAVARDFTMTNAQSTKFAPLASDVPVPSPTPTAAAPGTTRGTSTTPLWSAAAVGVVVLLLALGILIVSLRLRSRSAATAEPPTEVDNVSA